MGFYKNLKFYALGDASQSNLAGEEGLSRTRHDCRIFIRIGVRCFDVPFFPLILGQHDGICEGVHLGLSYFRQ